MQEKSSSRAAIIIASVACIAAAAAAIVAVYQAMIIRDSARQQARAYVTGRAEIKTGPNSEIFIWLENNGQTPARAVKSSANWQFIPAGQQLPANFAFSNTGDCPDVARTLGILFPRTPLRTGNLICPAITPKIVQAQRNELSAVLYGQIEYQDVFDETRKTQFCWILAATTNALCDRYNDVR
jgi:hypothetical protein